jgi:NADH:ubiquinone oxidoreductase subunit F (NADH-binding)
VFDRLYGVKENTEVSQPPGLTLGDFGMKRVNRFSKKRNGVKLTNSYMALQCFEDESCAKCEVTHEGSGELREVFNFEREVNNVEEGYVAG